MTMLEKMALRIAAEWQDAPVDMATFSWADVNGWTKDMAFDCARVALEAIREPSDTMLKDCAWDRADGMNGPSSEVAEWQSGIDAILNERTG